MYAALLLLVTNLVLLTATIMITRKLGIAFKFINIVNIHKAIIQIPSFLAQVSISQVICATPCTMDKN